MPYMFWPAGGEMYYFVGEYYGPGHMFGEAVMKCKAESLKKDLVILKYTVSREEFWDTEGPFWLRSVLGLIGDPHLRGCSSFCLSY